MVPGLNSCRGGGEEGGRGEDRTGVRCRSSLWTAPASCCLRSHGQQAVTGGLEQPCCAAHVAAVMCAAAAGSSLTRSFGKPCVLYARHVRTASTLLQLTTPTLAMPCGRREWHVRQAADHTDCSRCAVLFGCRPYSTHLEVARHLVHDRQQLVAGITLVLHDERHLQLSPTAVSPAARVLPQPSCSWRPYQSWGCLSLYQVADVVRVDLERGCFRIVTASLFPLSSRDTGNGAQQQAEGQRLLLGP